MPYINSEDRNVLDKAVSEAVSALNMSGEELLDKAGPLNYTITRICTGLLDKVSYRDIAILTGVIENVKQELYRRAAAPYEDQKIYENGDTREYSKFERDN